MHGQLAVGLTRIRGQTHLLTISPLIQLIATLMAATSAAMLYQIYWDYMDSGVRQSKIHQGTTGFAPSLVTVLCWG